MLCILMRSIFSLALDPVRSGQSVFFPSRGGRQIDATIGGRPLLLFIFHRSDYRIYHILFTPRFVLMNNQGRCAVSVLPASHKDSSIVEGTKIEGTKLPTYLQQYSGP